MLEGAWAQSELIRAYGELESLWPSYDVATVTLNGSTDELDDSVAQITERIDAIHEAGITDSFAGLGPLAHDVYTDKIAQFDAERDAFEAILAGLEELSDDENTPGDAHDILSDSPSPKSLENHIDELLCVASNMPESKELKADAEAAQQDGNPNTAERLREDALEVLTQCEHSSTGSGSD